MVKRVILSIIVAHCVSLSVFSQTNDTIKVVEESIDSLVITTVENVNIASRESANPIAKSSRDTLVWIDDQVELDKSTEKVLMKKEPFKPDPTKAVIYSAIFPGLGQIYNRRYWKLPIVYGGVLGLVYAITWNGRMYSDYTKAYKAIMSDDYIAKKSDYSGIFPADVDPASWTDSQLQSYRDNIRRRRDFNRRNRDLSIIGAVALYALCMIDSYVDAQLYDFNMSPDLSFRVEPRIGLDDFSQISFGLQCSIRF